LPEFYQRFLQLKAQTPKVSDKQVIAQAIKYKIQHFRKLEQQWRVVKTGETSRAHYGDNHCNYPKPVHNIGSNKDRASENWNKSYRAHRLWNPRPKTPPPPKQPARWSFEHRSWVRPRPIHNETPVLHVPRQ
jgi:hypothetical protein